MKDAAIAPPGAWIVQSSLRIWAPHVLPHVAFAELTAQVLIVNLFIGIVAWAIQRVPAGAETMDGKEDVIEPATPASAQDSLRSRLPFQLRSAAILSLSAEDHYVRVRTDRGQTLVLMNLLEPKEETR
jgi:hypothetical protein